MMNKDTIKRIPAGLEKNLGVGDMILPSEETVAYELKKISKNSLITIPQLREQIAQRFRVTTACPKTTLSTLRGMIDKKSQIASRVVNGKGELISKDPYKQLELLKNDHFEIDQLGNKLKVKDFKKYLV
jgi:hypothetical protein